MTTQVHIKFENGELPVSALNRGTYFVFEGEMYIRIGGKETDLIAVSLMDGLAWDRTCSANIVRVLSNVTIKEGV